MWAVDLDLGIGQHEIRVFETEAQAKVFLKQCDGGNYAGIPISQAWIWNMNGRPKENKETK